MGLSHFSTEVWALWMPVDPKTWDLVIFQQLVSAHDRRSARAATREPTRITLHNDAEKQ